MSKPGSSPTDPGPELTPEPPTLPPSQPGNGPSSGTLQQAEPRGAGALPLAAAAGREFGDYELLAEVARGGMGIVYQARQKGLNRIVALKMILPGSLANPEDVRRFQTEAEAAARLQHPNIVAVHEVGAAGGQHFYSMEYIDGPSLARRLESGPLPGHVAARYVRTIAQAVHFAHRHGILHRDLKPSNILLDPNDEPHVADFGLAKKLGVDPGQTRTGAILGTPSYMAPEQAAGRIKELGPACDVYGLGAVLYELLTGRPPFRSETTLDTLLHVLEQEPAPPRLLNPKIDRDLETICLKCLSKNPLHRYASAEALADDLTRYLNGESITARSFNLIDRLARTLERSQHAVEFRSWGTILLFFAAIVFLGHLAMFLLAQTGQPPALNWVARTAQFALMGLVFYHFRARTVLPTTPAERQLWSIWIGYLVAYLFTVLVSRELAGRDREWDELTLYPSSAILTGLAFFVMGSNYWGRCYALGLAFFALALVMPWNLAWAPLEFGALWSLTLVLIGLHVRRLGTGT